MQENDLSSLIAFLFLVCLCICVCVYTADGERAHFDRQGDSSVVSRFSLDE